MIPSLNTKMHNVDEKMRNTKDKMLEYIGLRFMIPQEHLIAPFNYLSCE